MQYQTLGKTGLQVSRMGLGGIPIQRIDKEGTRSLIHQLRNAGVNFIDTARGYTVSEEYLGYALEGIREDFIIATKSMARTADDMAADIQRSLQNLRTDYIDLYQLHNPNMAQLEQITAPGGALEALLTAKASGKIRHIGITAHLLQVFEAALELDWVETVMFPYNLVEEQGEALIRSCAQRNIGFICMKPLAGGAIEDATLALRFIASNPDVSVIIPGMAEDRELEQNLAAVNDTSPLRREELEKIHALRSQLGTQFCRRCNYCAPCTVGIAIPAVLVADTYFSRYGLQDWARSRYNAMEAKASDCVGCGVCESRCPYQLPIRQMLQDAAAHFEGLPK